MSGQACDGLALRGPCMNGADESGNVASKFTLPRKEENRVAFHKTEGHRCLCGVGVRVQKFSGSLDSRHQGRRELKITVDRFACVWVGEGVVETEVASTPLQNHATKAQEARF